MFVLFDTFNHKVVSRHRGLGALVAANTKLQNAVSKYSRSSYIPTKPMKESKDGLVGLNESEFED